MQDDTVSTGELAGRPGYTGRHGYGGESSEPDVLLDVPQLRVDEIILDVEDLHAHVSVEANVLNLLRLSVGADVQLGGVHLEIRGVEAQVLLKVRLDKVAEIINRVLATIDRNPEIVGQIVPPLETAVGALEGTAERSVDEVTDTGGSATPPVDGFVTETTGEPDESDAIAEEQALLEAPQYDAEPGRADEGTPRGLLRRRKQERSTEEPSP
jgi:hypothetical protein